MSKLKDKRYQSFSLAACINVFSLALFLPQQTALAGVGITLGVIDQFASEKQLQMMFNSINASANWL